MSNTIIHNHTSLEPTRFPIEKEKSDDSLIQEAAKPILNFLSLTNSSPFTHPRESSEFSVSKKEDEGSDPIQAAAFPALNQANESRLKANIQEARSIGIQMGKAVPQGVSMPDLDRLEIAGRQRKSLLLLSGIILLSILAIGLALHNPILAIIGGAILLTAAFAFLLNHNKLATIERQIDAYERLFHSNNAILSELHGQINQEALDHHRAHLGLDQDWQGDLDDLRMHTLHQRKEKERWNQYIVDLVFKYFDLRNTEIFVLENELFSKNCARESIKQFTIELKMDLILFLKKEGAFDRSEYSPIEIISELTGLRPWFVEKCLEGTFIRREEVRMQIRPLAIAHKYQQQFVSAEECSLLPLMEQLDKKGFFENDRYTQTVSVLHEEFGYSGVQIFQLLAGIRNPGLVHAE